MCGPQTGRPIPVCLFSLSLSVSAIFEVNKMLPLCFGQNDTKCDRPKSLWLCPDLYREGHYEMTAGVCLSVSLSVCRVPRPNLTTERHRKPKIGTIEPHHTANQWTYLKVKRSKIKVSRSINAVTDRSTGIPVTQSRKWKHIPLNRPK